MELSNFFRSDRPVHWWEIPVWIVAVIVGIGFFFWIFFGVLAPASEHSPFPNGDDVRGTLNSLEQKTSSQ